MKTHLNQIVQTALKRGKSVVSANKKMIAEHHEVLIQLSRENGVSFLYEAAVCGSVPIIRNLEEYFDNDLLNSVHGIVNGSTNFILCKMYEENQPYDEALKVAQESQNQSSETSSEYFSEDELKSSISKLEEHMLETTEKFNKEMMHYMADSSCAGLKLVNMEEDCSYKCQSSNTHLSVNIDKYILMPFASVL